jgi:hypothetical protein
MRLKWCCFFLLLIGLGCSLTRQNALAPTSTAPPLPISIQPIAATPAPTPFPVIDANALFAETCFEGLLALSGQRLIIGDRAGLGALYDLMDSRCPEPMPRAELDFSTQVLIVVGQVTQACTAELNPLSLTNGQLVLQFSQSGECPYEALALYVGLIARSEGLTQITVP